MLETLQNTKTIEKTRRRAMAVLCVVVGLALILVAAGLCQNYRWTHRSPNKYEDELPLYGIEAVGKPASVPKTELRQLISNADTPPMLQETRWYRDIMRGLGVKVTMTPEDILIFGMYATNIEDRYGIIEDFQGQTIEVAYCGDGGYVLGGGEAGSIFDGE